MQLNSSQIDSQNSLQIDSQNTNSQNNSQSNQIDDLLHQSFQVAEDILFRQVAQDAILLHIPSSSYYSLNETSLVFWQALEQRQPLYTAVETITAEYDVECAQVLNDLQVFLQDLLNFGLISLAQTDS